MTVTEQTLFRVSLAVRLQDDFSREAYLVDKTRVFIKEDGRTALQNPSRHHVFTGVPQTNVTIRTENRFYFPKETGVNIPGLDPRTPLVAVTMKPNYLYPFPSTSTLGRGIILDPGNVPVEKAQVSIAGSTVTNESEADGRFVLYWGPLEENDIAVVGKHRCLKIGGVTAIDLNVNHPAFQPKTLTIGTIVEGELKLLTTPIVLNP